MRRWNNPEAAVLEAEPEVVGSIGFVHNVVEPDTAAEQEFLED